MSEQKVEIGGTTPDEVAFRLWNVLRHEHKGLASVDDKLAFFAECRRAAFGSGKYKLIPARD